MRCTGCFSFDTDLGEKTKAFGAGALFLAGLWVCSSALTVRLLGLNGCAFGDEGNAAADAAASVCGAGCRVAGAAVADTAVCEVDDSAAGGSVTGATGADLGAGAVGCVAWAAGAA